MGINFIHTPYNLFLPLIALVFCLAAIIIGLDVVWRVDKRLSLAMKLFIAAAVGVAIRKVNNVLGNTNSNAWLQMAQYIDMATGIFFLLAFLEMFKIVRRLSKEK